MYRLLFINKGGRKSNIPDAYSWVVFYDKLASGDVLKYEAVGEINYLQALNKLSLMYYESKDIEDQQKEIK